MSDIVFNLTKDEPIFNLSKDKLSISKILFCGCGWKTKGYSSVDVDLSILAVNSINEIVSTCSFQNKKRLISKCMYHFGDDLTGNDHKTDIDNEQVQLDLGNAPLNISAFYIMAGVYSGSLKDIESMYGCIRNSDQVKEVNANMTNMSDKGIMLAKVYRDDNDWKIERIDKPINTGRVYEAAPYINGTLQYGQSLSGQRITSRDQVDTNHDHGFLNWVINLFK